jgi:hypothetical protein
MDVLPTPEGGVQFQVGWQTGTAAGGDVLAVRVRIDAIEELVRLAHDVEVIPTLAVTHDIRIIQPTVRRRIKERWTQTIV